MANDKCRKSWGRQSTGENCAVVKSQVDVKSCSAYLGEDCQYLGERLGKINFEDFNTPSPEN